MPGQGSRCADLVDTGRRLPRAAVVGRLLARRRGRSVSAGRPRIPTHHRARSEAHRGVVGYLGGGESEGGSADARARLGGDDARRVRRSVRLRPCQRRRMCGQNVATRSLIARLFDAGPASTSTYSAHVLEPPVRIELTTARLQGECSTTELRRPVNRCKRIGSLLAIDDALRPHRA